MLLVDRFNAMSKRGDGCWEWTGGRDEKGYGIFYIAGKKVRAHRLAYDLFVGEISNGQWVLHDCDNPSCVRPDHLHLGDNLMNTREKMVRGRHRGRNPAVRFTKEKALAVHAAEGSASSIASRLGVSKTTVLRIKRGDHWSLEADA